MSCHTAIFVLMWVGQHMFFDNLNDLLQVVIGVLIVEESVGQVFQGFEKAVEIHLVVVGSPHHVLVDYIIVSL